MFEYKDIINIYNYLIKSEYKIINDDKIKKIILNDKKIELNEKLLTNEELIKILMDEINKQNEKINKLIKINEDKDEKINKLEIKYDKIMEKIDELDENKQNKDKTKIQLIYRTDNERTDNIFGSKFVEKNKDNIELYVNDVKLCQLIGKYNLKKGDNIITIKIINPIINLEYMFYNCDKLININELRYLDTKYCNNFSYIFYGCSSLVDIKGLKN